MDFTNWLVSITSVYKTLPDEKQKEVLEALIDASGPRTLFDLQSNVEMLKRDFLAFLPRELSLKILLYLDPWTLFTCEQVSCCWKAIINESPEVWREACLEVGVPVASIESTHTIADLKKMFIRVSYRLHQLLLCEDGAAFTETALYGHTDHVVAICYWNGLLATGSLDRTVKVWDCATENCRRTFRTHYSIAVLKFDGERLLTGFFDCTAACWDMQSGQQVQVYKGHTAVILSLDYNAAVNILVTGSTDRTVKLWLLSEGQLLRNIEQNIDSLRQVMLSSSSSGAADTLDSISLITYSNSCLNVWSLSLPDLEPALQDCWKAKDGDTVQIYNSPKLTNTVLHFAVKIQSQGCEKCFVVQANLECRTKGGCFVQHECSVCSERIPTVWIPGLQYHVLMETNPFKIGIRRLGFSAEEDFLAYIWCDANYKLKSPMDYESWAKRFISLGDANWLDGLDGKNDNGIFFIGCTGKDNGVLLLKWKRPDVDELKSFIANMANEENSSKHRNAINKVHIGTCLLSHK